MRPRLRQHLSYFPGFRFTSKPLITIPIHGDEWPSGRGYTHASPFFCLYIGGVTVRQKDCWITGLCFLAFTRTEDCMSTLQWWRCLFHIDFGFTHRDTLTTLCGYVDIGIFGLDLITFLGLESKWIYKSALQTFLLILWIPVNHVDNATRPLSTPENGTNWCWDHAPDADAFTLPLAMLAIPRSREDADNVMLLYYTLTGFKQVLLGFEKGAVQGR
jgi:hypothetical protein